MCWLYPGKDITIEAPCLDCGEPLRVVVRDGVIREQSPQGVFGFIDVPYYQWRDNRPYS